MIHPVADCLVHNTLMMPFFKIPMEKNKKQKNKKKSIQKKLPEPMPLKKWALTLMHSMVSVYIEIE